ncbi:hypothetical protein GQ600_1142 [Phytophthora cactorum]|nr:hypothetical protein GQ600_1142 [Phytophthora cactorum]
MAPIVNEPDDNLKAESHPRPWSLCSLSSGRSGALSLPCGRQLQCKQKLVCLMNVPLVGCASHRLNLAAADFQAELDLIQKLMVRLRTLSQAAKLRPTFDQVLPGHAVGFDLLHLARFFEIREHLDADDEAIEDLLPFPSTLRSLRFAGEDEDGGSVPSASSPAMSRCGVRALFDALLQQFPVFGKYLDPYFESAVVKLQRGRPLGRQEKAAVSVLKVASGGPSADNLDDGFAERVLKCARVSEQTDKYILAAAILPTSNIVERLFSMDRAMIGLSDTRLAIMSSMLFLKVNISYWDVNVVHDIL